MISISAQKSAILRFFCLLSITAIVIAGDQTQWGEKFSRNMVSDEKNLPEDFDPVTGKNIKWSAQLGYETHGTPMVAQRKVFIGTNNGYPRDSRQKGDRGVLMCFDEKDGSFCWQLVVPKITTSVYWDWTGSGICSPATIEGDKVYIVTSHAEVMCLDINGMVNGNDGPFKGEGRQMVPAGQEAIEPGKTDADIIWLFDLIKECGIRQHDSAHCSILLDGQFLYVNTSTGVDDTHRHIASPDAPCLIVLDKTTGRIVARDDEHFGPNVFHCTWSSPALGEVNGRKLIFYAAPNGVVYAFEPVKSATDEIAKLKKVWWFDIDPTGAKENVHRFTANRKESPSTIHSMPVFYKNRIYVAGGGDIWWGKRESWLKCIDATKTGDVTKTAEIWSYPLTRHNLSTPAIYNGLAFVADSGHKIHCVDAETGKPYWTHDVQGEMWASTLAADGKVYIGTRRGEFVVFAASKEKRVISAIELNSPISGTATAANGVLYVVTQKYLYAVQKSAAGQVEK
ncbi:MAG: PQQ-binding-like beta-propeller repeat protein [Kiritimatiellae bacterium]|nr:PQQ-binding-like beta-propeller repeat protein [Kiritimatiellia bacterium]